MYKRILCSTKTAASIYSTPSFYYLADYQRAIKFATGQNDDRAETGDVPATWQHMALQMLAGNPTYRFQLGRTKEKKDLSETAEGMTK